jgi:hypothetical protein
MFDSIKKICVALVLLAAAGRAAFGFALLGPINEPWQVSTIGYAESGAAAGFGDINGNADVGAPKNFGQGYRLNVPTIVYAYDSTFSGYFGAQGEAAVDAAFATFNSLNKVSSYSSNLAEVPLSTSRYNLTAENLNLLDIKSVTMQIMIEQLGLAQSVRWVWAIHDRYTGSGLVCGNYEYAIIMRNYDTIAQASSGTPYSKYVNGILYGYTIFDFCSETQNPYAPLLADAEEYTSDPALASLNQPVSSLGLQNGQYYTGLTRDDIMGLRYLYAATNVVTETTDPSSFLYYTNTAAPVVLVSSNYGLFLQQALTNSPAALLALYPGLVITSSNSYFGPLITTNVSISDQLVPGGYVGELQSVTTTTYTTNYQNLYNYTFGNVVVRNTTPTTAQVTQTVTIQPTPGGYVGEFSDTTNFSTSTLNETNGDFYIIPAGLCGAGYYFPTNYPPIPNLVGVTNVIPVSTNNVSSNLSTKVILAQQTVTYFTNYILVAVPIQCASNVTELRQGVEKINFVRQDFDSEIGQAWTPVTNIYTAVAITNGQPRNETLIRVLNQPDILINAADLLSGPDAAPVLFSYFRTVPNFNQTPKVGQYGPGTINPYPSAVYSTNGLNFTFNTAGPVFFNGGPSFIENGATVYSDVNGGNGYVYGSFDGSTNAPIVYPNTLSIAQLESQVYFQITSSLLPNASLSANTASNPYSTQLQAQSASGPPFTWSYVSNSTLLPAGLTLSTNGVISGVPTAPQGTYDFNVQAKDSAGRVTAKALFVVITP